MADFGLVSVLRDCPKRLVEIDLGPRHQSNFISPLTEQQEHANVFAASRAKAARCFPCLGNLHVGQRAPPSLLGRRS
jgi:hypothetical protein